LWPSTQGGPIRNAPAGPSGQTVSSSPCCPQAVLEQTQADCSPPEIGCRSTGVQRNCCRLSGTGLRRSRACGPHAIPTSSGLVVRPDPGPLAEWKRPDCTFRRSAPNLGRPPCHPSGRSGARPSAAPPKSPHPSGFAYWRRYDATPHGPAWRAKRLPMVTAATTTSAITRQRDRNRSVLNANQARVPELPVWLIYLDLQAGKEPGDPQPHSPDCWPHPHWRATLRPSGVLVAS